MHHALFSCNFLLLKSKSFPWSSGIKTAEILLVPQLSVSRITKEKTGRKIRDACDRTILLFRVYIAKRKIQVSELNDT